MKGRRLRIDGDIPAGRRVVLAGLFLLVPAGCGEPEGPGVVRQDSAGVEVVVSHGPVWKAGRGWRVEREPLLCLGTVDPGEVERFFQVGEALRAGDGRILVENRGTQEIRVFGPDGAFLRSLGGWGEDPGDLVRLAGVAVSGDTLFGFDAYLERISLFDLDDGFLGHVEIESPGIPLRLYRLAGRLPDGELVLAPDGFPAGRRSEPTLYWDSLPHLLYGPDGAVRDTIGPFAGLEIFGAPEFWTPPPFARRSVADVGAGRFAVGRSFDWSVRVHGAGGRLERVVRRRGGPPPVREREARRALESRLSGIQSEETRREIRERHRRIRFPDRRPAYADLTVARDGGLWVREFRPAWETGPETWHVFSPEGRWLGGVLLPERFRATEIGQDWILGVRRDALDVERVELYRLTRR